MIISNSDLKVSIYHGQSDSVWNDEKWKTEINFNEVPLVIKLFYHVALIHVVTMFLLGLNSYYYYLFNFKIFNIYFAWISVLKL